MTPQDWVEVPVFVHGITPNIAPRNHDADYDPLFQLIQEELKRKRKAGFDRDPIKVEWGWLSPHVKAGDPYKDQFLAEAERKVLEHAEAAEQELHDFTFNPARLLRDPVRQFFFIGCADLFYYVSRDGEASIRGRVFKYLADEVQKVRGRSVKGISLTLITHSGGTIITHDLLYHLFRAEEIAQAKALEAGKEERDAITQLRAQVSRGKLRIRRFYTMGSPIAPLIVRSDSLIEKIIKGDLLDPEDLGLRQSDGLASHPRWVNFVDKDDLASYPISFLYRGAGTVVEDKHIEVSDFISLAHEKYWTSRSLAKYIAHTF